MYALHAVLILTNKTSDHISLILLMFVYALDPSSTPTPTRLDCFRVRVKGVAAACRLASSIRRHGAITIISTSTWEDISYRVIPTLLETGRR